MIPSTPFGLFVYQLDRSPVSASLNFTLASVKSRGGYGLIGDGDIGIVKALGTLATPTGVNNPVPTAKVLQGGTTGTAYSETISAQGGTSPYTFVVTTGSLLPAGLSLVSGIISGTPTTAGTSNFTIQATDANGVTGSTAFEIVVAAAGSGGAAAMPNYCIIN